MVSQLTRRLSLLIVLAVVCKVIFAQGNVPLGIHYQAVARDNFGNELVNKKISVKFSIISDDPLSDPVYQELHQDVTTSKFGVFSIIIGNGIITGNSPCLTLSEIPWQTADHFLKVEVKFDNDFMYMGTMQFLAVPYALYAQKSLEPGPAGPKGDQGEKGLPGDPASDDQTLSVVNIEGSDYLTISGGNQVKISSIERDGDPTNEIQDLVINSDVLKITNNPNATPWSLMRYLDNTDNQALTWDAANRVLGIGGNTGTVNLSELKNDADADPLNEIQDISFRNDSLKISKNPSSTGISLAKYLVDNDKQALKWDPVKRRLGIIGDTATINLSELKNDADASPTNEIQDLELTGNILKITGKSGATPINLATYLDDTDDQGLSYNDSTKTLSIDGGKGTKLGTLVAFRAKKNNITSATMPLSNIDFIPNEIEYNDGDDLIQATGIFTAPFTGSYAFDIKYIAPSTGDGRMLMLYKNGNPYETLGTGISSGTTLYRNITIKLLANESVKLVIYTGTGTEIGTGYFSGHRVY